MTRYNPDVPPPPTTALANVDRARVKQRARERLFGLDPQPVRIDRYELGERIGRGGSAQVFSAWDPRLERHIALKLIQPGQADSLEHVEARVQREARVLAKLSHPNVVQVYDVGRQEEFVFIAMELISGSNLHVWQGEQSSWKTIVANYVLAGRGLAAAHGVGLIHKDFKPANVLIDEANGKVCVVDFGIARNTASGSGSGQTTTARSSDPSGGSSTDPLACTPLYAAPEQMAGGALDARCDQFAFCVSLFEALFGHAPYSGGNRGALQFAKQEGNIVPFARGKVPRTIVAAIERGLSPNPDDRFPTLDALLEELRLPRSWKVPAFASVAVAIGLSVGWSLRIDPDECDRYQAQASEAWNVEARTQLRDAFERSGVPYAASTADVVAKDLDHRFEAWATRAGVACRAAASSGETRTLRCLDRQLLTMTGLKERFGRATPGVVEAAPQAVAQLPALDECEEPVTVPYGLDPGVLTEVDRVLAGAQADVAATRWDAAVEGAQNAQDLASRHGLEHEALAAQIVHGKALLGQRELDTGIAMLVEAGTKAETLDDDRLAWRAWMAVARIGTERPDRRDVVGWLARAEAASSGLGDDDDVRRLRLLFARANTETIEAHEISPTLTRVWDELAKADAGDPRVAELRRVVATSLAARKLASSNPAEAAEYARTAVELAETQLGAGHPKTLETRLNLGYALIESCLEDDAAALLSAAAAEAAPLWPAPSIDHATLHLELAQLELRQGQFERALQSLERGMDMLPQGPTGQLRGSLILGRAVVEFARGDLPEAQRFAGLAATEFGAEGIDAGRAFAQAVEAEILLHQGEDAEARVTASNAREALTKTMGEAGEAYMAVPLKVEATVALRRGDLDRAAADFQRAHAANTPCETLDGADLDLGLAETRARQGQAEEARRLRDRAERAYAELGNLGARRRAMFEALLVSAEP